MTFESILFQNVTDRTVEVELRAPNFFFDLNLDQIVAALTANKAEYNLTPFFYMPLHDINAVIFRHEVMRDLEVERLFGCITSFASAMRSVQEHLSELEKRYYEHQKEWWFLEAVNLYGAAVRRLAQDLLKENFSSRGLLALRDYLAQYVSSERYLSLIGEVSQLKEALAEVRYSIFIHGPLVEVHRAVGKPDYSAELEATFERFQQGATHEYIFKFGDSTDMNHIEAKILDGVAFLYQDIFLQLSSFRTNNKDFLDPTISAFDREIQFYVAYIDFIAPMKKAGLAFCYPAVSVSGKEIHNRDGFDLALADKLVKIGTIPVSNDFYLEDPERIIVISGPNQGGKTTFARTFGQLHYLASLGCPVPGTEAQLYLPDTIFTHFEREEHMTNLRGKLEDDVVRIHAILKAATPRSLVVINEIFASTTLRDAISLSRKIASQIMDCDILCAWVTFLDEVSSLSEKTVSMTSTIVPENPAQRTFKIVRRPADGLAYAMALAEKYRLTYQMIKERTEP
jgi:DNA mismatch repair protein MutS